MANTVKPVRRPAVPHFSSGPCAKRPGWSPEVLKNAYVARSHRAKAPLARLQSLIEKSKALLGLPPDYLLAIMPGSDTGAFEAALWSMLGARGVDVLAWENFGKTWATDVVKQLKLEDARVLEAPYGELPDLGAVDFARDVVFAWNGTTSGVRVPDGSWIPAGRQGLAFVDGTSAAFAQEIDWPKVDVLTYSWQKALGGEAQHGMLVLSPRAVARLESYTPPWPLPKVFRLTKNGKLDRTIFAAETINTPSMLCVEDHHDALDWAERIGGGKSLTARADANAAALSRWVERTPWIEHLARDPRTRSNTSVCLKIADPAVARLDKDGQAAFVKRLAGQLESEGVAYDIAGHREAPPSLRIWCGTTVETSDIEALCPWLDWAFVEAKHELAKAA
ncbi:MAG: phosphoserine transaminase [Hyphomicrobiaceae bacterium]